MNPKKPHWLRASTLVLLPILTFAPFYGANAQDEEETAADPWFSQDREAQLEEDEDSESGRGALLGKSKSARALYNRLISAYDKLAEGNLSKRISTLEEAITISPEQGAKNQSELDELRQIKADALSAIQSASQSTTPLNSAIDGLAQFRRYFAGDPSLSFQLIDSPFNDRLDSRIRALGRNGEFEQIAALEDRINSAGLNQVIGERFGSTMRNALATIIERKWDSSTGEIAPLVGESYLFGRLIQAPEKKLTLQLDFPQNVDERLSANISRSLERSWGDNFKIESNSRSRVGPDFILEVDVANIDTDTNEEVNTVFSSVPGKITEEANPEFMAMVKKYEKAAKRYESAMISYEINYDRYLEQFEDREFDDAQQNLQQAENQAASVMPESGPGGPGEAYASAQENLNLAQAVAASVTSNNIPEPVRPSPFHLEILDELYLIPSTIVTSSESTPYEYKSKKLDYSFEGNANIALSTPANTSIKTEGKVDLHQERKWVKNEGIHRSDPTAEPGNYSEAELNSALDIFSLEFGSSCSERFGELLKQVGSQLNGVKLEKDGISQVLLSLSLAANEYGSAKYALSNAELQELATLARSPNVSAKEFRIECLSYILDKSNMSGSVSKQVLQELL